MIQTAPFEVKEFHGGITDNYIDNAKHKYRTADNLLVTINKKLYTRPGSQIWDATNPQIPAGAQRIGTFFEHENDLLVQSAKKFYFVSAGAWSTLQGPTGNDVFTTGTTASVVSSTKWNHHLYVTNSDFSPVMKIYEDNGGIRRVRNAGLPILASTPTVASSGPAGTSNYVYAFLYYYTYNASSLAFEDFGATVQVALTNVTTPDVSTVNITAIPVLANGVTNNYDTTNIKVKIYRTIDGGTEFYYIGEVTNGTTTYNDSAADDTIQLNELVYFTGDLLENDPPPLCKYLAVGKGICWYAHIKEGSQIYSNRIRQSLVDDPDSCPTSLYIDVEDEITGIGMAGFTPIILCKNSVYRLDGFFADDGSGDLRHQQIEDSIGCIGQASVIGTEGGIYFAAEDGFYFCDGYLVKKVSGEFNDSYGLFVTTEEQRRRIYGTYDRENNRVWWAVQRDGATDCDACYILDLRWTMTMQADVSQLISTFTTASGGSSFAPTALIFYDKQLIRGDKRGYLLKHDEDYLSDPVIDTTISVANWLTQPIIWNYESCATSFGDTINRKWVPWILLYASNKTNISIQIKSNNDVNKKYADLTPIRFRQNIVWGDPLYTWGDSDLIWNYDGIIEQKRRFNAGHLRCSYKQVGITNAYVIVVASDDMTTATVDALAKTVLLDDIVNYKWPSDIANYYIYFDSDNYTTAYLIESRTDSTLTIIDPGSTLVSGSHKWQIKGYPKNEILDLLGYTVHFAPLTPTQQVYTAAETGGND